MNHYSEYFAIKRSDILRCISARPEQILMTEGGEWPEDQPIRFLWWSAVQPIQLLCFVRVGTQCHELYGSLDDSGSTSGRHLICNSEHRVQQLLVSRGHIVRVWIDHSTQLSRFLIHYSGVSQFSSVQYDTLCSRNSNSSYHERASSRHIVPAK